MNKQEILQQHQELINDAFDDILRVVMKYNKKTQPLAEQLKKLNEQNNAKEKKTKVKS